MKNLGEPTQFINYQIKRDYQTKQIYLHQQDFIAELLQYVNLADCYPSKTKGTIFVKGLQKADTIISDMNGINYRSVTGALLHLAIHSRPDIAFEVATLCKYNSCPGKLHWQAIEQLCKFLKYTVTDALTMW